MGIWYDAKIICGVEIRLSLDILRNIHSFDNDFVYDDFKYETDYGGDISSKSIYKIRKKIDAWLLEKYPTLKIYSSIPYYDCDYNKRRYYLALRLSCSDSVDDISLSDFITILNNVNVDEFRKVFAILFSDESEKSSEPIIQGIPYIW